jgi:hypothetical protein
MNDEMAMYSLSEKEYINYLNKIYLDKLAVNELLFNDPLLSGNVHIQALLCEQFAACHFLETLLREAEDSFDDKDQIFYLAEEQATRFVVLLSSLVHVKEELLKSSVSLSFH